MRFVYVLNKAYLGLTIPKFKFYYQDNKDRQPHVKGEDETLGVNKDWGQREEEGQRVNKDDVENW